jgi:fructoselysine-6-P-deglycase FrlB-like protein
MSVMAQMATGVSSSAMAAGDILLHAGRYGKCFDNAVIVCVSRSGRTSELLMALDALKSQGYSFTVASLVCADDTPLAAKSNFTLSMPWAFDNSVCQTRCVTNFYFAAAYIISKITGNQAVLDDLAHIINNGPEFAKKAEKLADDFSEHPWTHCVVLADAELEGIAEEGALAFKEICQLPSNYYHLLDLRHGPMVLLGEKTLALVALGAKNELENKLLLDIKGKKSEIITFSDTPVEYAQIIYGHPLSHIASGIPFIVLCQMVAYKKSLKTGADSDRPTGLNAWITL